MAAALACAERGRGAVEPNPMVGAVIVRDEVELARGWHKRFGGPHAEIEALDAARAAGHDVRGATVYVTLEPCCHPGKTPPCTEALIAAGVSRVVVAMVDPDAKVAGKGVGALREAGIEVTVGVLEDDARRLLAAYIKHRTTGRPWVICKWAQTTDGYLALPPGEDRWISSPASRDRVHEIRSGCDGILVGIGTVLADDPLLTHRTGQGKQPTRVVLDTKLRIPLDCRLLKTLDVSPVIIATTAAAGTEPLQEAGAEVLTLPAAETGVDLPSLLDDLGRRGWIYLLVEGGAEVLRSFIEAHLADELLVFIAPKTVGPGHDDLPRFGYEAPSRLFDCKEEQAAGLDGDQLLRFVRVVE